MMNNEYKDKDINVPTQADETFWAEDYVWATSEESKRDALSLYFIGSIVHKHRGTLQIDPENNVLNIDVPDEEKLACAEELREKAGITLH